MAEAVKKYNPGFLTDQQIIDTFCVRTAEFDSLVESLREIDDRSSPHSLVIGPRGSGKTHLLLRVAAEVRRNPALTGLTPITFAEESYEVTTCGEFWLECLGRLADQAPGEERNNLRLSYEELRTVTDDQVLIDRCIGSLLDFADRHETRLVLIVENLNMLFSDIGDPDVGWQLRQTLQTEPRIILLGSATSRFDEIDNPEHALYDLFRVITLRPLDTDECTTLWKSVAGKSSTTEAVRPLEILTGGNPRLLTIIARFGAKRSFRDLMENVLDLVDEHTEYFKSHLESLPPQERRVYLALARLWRPSTSREVADLARLDTNACSAQLKRLVARGAVTIEGGTPRRRQYYLTERLYNIYYLLRRGMNTDRFVQALIEFMTCLYSPLELGDVLESLYEDVHASHPFQQIFTKQIVDILIGNADSLTESGRSDEALELYDKIIGQSASTGDSEFELQLASAIWKKSFLLFNLKRANETLISCNEYLSRVGMRSDENFAALLASVQWLRGISLGRVGDLHRSLTVFDRALAQIRHAESAVPSFLVATIILSKGALLVDMNRPAEALAVFDQVVIESGTDSDSVTAYVVTRALTAKALLLDRVGQVITEAEFRLLLRGLAAEDVLPEGSIAAIVPFVAWAGPAKTLSLIETSTATHVLQPLSTALRQELERTPRVSREVAEVANDVRARLAEARARQAQARAQEHAS